ncbi:Crp/Fnr family transcriptional regulator [Puia dinghuensis]|uniref:cAMP-binding protein n=1 Tax=Puia dinghuensis TaxID=1792502 RepID=A0A8J2XQG5_9BACT|nr:Crp/Fnr family transcriptional regulator [Puia dinghuensis]GGA84856.1 cAMP-binding protein [Puia dinghuensis]
MNKEPVINFIRDTLLSSNVSISRKLLEEIAGHFEPTSFARNDYFVTAGKVNTHHFFMTEGFMRAFTYNPEGVEVTTDFFKSNRPVFEATSFITKTRSIENIQAITNCEGFLLSSEKSNELFHALPEFREFGRRMLLNEFAAYKKRTLLLITQTAEERYAELINTNKEIFQYAHLKHIASYLGITDSSLSRIRKDFSKKQ